MRIEITDKTFHEMLIEVCQTMPSSSVTFKVLEEKVKKMTEHDLYSQFCDTSKTVEERNKAIKAYYESKGIPESFRSYLKK